MLYLVWRLGYYANVLDNGRMKRMQCQLAVLMAKHDPRMSQRDLAHELDLSHTTINKLYNGRPLTAVIKPQTVEKICNFFGCEIGELLTLAEVSEEG